MTHRVSAEHVSAKQEMRYFFWEECFHSCSKGSEVGLVRKFQLYLRLEKGESRGRNFYWEQ